MWLANGALQGLCGQRMRAKQEGNRKPWSFPDSCLSWVAGDSQQCSSSQFLRWFCCTGAVGGILCSVQPQQWELLPAPNTSCSHLKHSQTFWSLGLTSGSASAASGSVPTWNIPCWLQSRGFQPAPGVCSGNTTGLKDFFLFLVNLECSKYPAAHEQFPRAQQ